MTLGLCGLVTRTLESTLLLYAQERHQNDSKWSSVLPEFCNFCSLIHVLFEKPFHTFKSTVSSGLNVPFRPGVNFCIWLNHTCSFFSSTPSPPTPELKVATNIVPLIYSRTALYGKWWLLIRAWCSRILVATSFLVGNGRKCGIWP